MVFGTDNDSGCTLEFYGAWLALITSFIQHKGDQFFLCHVTHSNQGKLGSIEVCGIASDQVSTIDFYGS